MHLSGYRFMWLVVMFDLPVDTKKARRNYTRFRKQLLRDGFTKMQFSIYTRHCSSQENADVHVPARDRLGSRRRRGSRPHHHRQAVRAHAYLLGKKTQTAGKTSCSTDAFLAWFKRASFQVTVRSFCGPVRSDRLAIVVTR